MSLNQKIIEWVNEKARLGKQVGAGECWDLAEQAVLQAGGKSSKDLTADFGENSDYVWGSSVTVSAVQAGDIVQFRDYRWTVKTVTRTDGSDGSWNENQNIRKQERPHHTAIVVAVEGNGRIRVVEQNVAGKRVPHGNPIQLTSVTHDPVVTESKKGAVTVKTTVTVTEEVTGTVWIYRPAPKA